MLLVHVPRGDGQDVELEVRVADQGADLGDALVVGQVGFPVAMSKPHPAIHSSHGRMARRRPIPISPNPAWG